MWAPLREQLPYINMTVLDHANTAVVIFTPGVRSASSLPLPTKTPTGSSKDDAGGGSPRVVERLPRLLHPHCALHPQRHHRHHRRYLQARPADATDGEDAASAGAAGGANHQQQNQVRRRAGADLCRGCFLLLRIVPVIRSRWSSAFP
jgi:hypothetical protein